MIFSLPLGFILLCIKIIKKKKNEKLNRWLLIAFAGLPVGLVGLALVFVLWAVFNLISVFMGFDLLTSLPDF